MTARVLTGSKQEIAQKIAGMEGEVREAIVFVDDVAASAGETTPERAGDGAADVFAEMEPYTVAVDGVDDSRAAIYSPREGMTVEQASQWLSFFRRRFTLLPDRDDLSARWQELVSTMRVTGFRAHDARLVAAMQSYGITRLLTFNGADFRGFSITAVDPASV